MELLYENSENSGLLLLPMPLSALRLGLFQSLPHNWPNWSGSARYHPVFCQNAALCCRSNALIYT